MSSWNRELGIPLESLQGNWATSQTEAGKSRFFLSCGGKWGFSLVATANSGILSSGTGYLAEPRELHKGSQASFRVSRRNSGLLSMPCRGKEPHLTLRGESSACSQVVVGSSGVLLSCDGNLCQPVVLPQGSQFSFLIGMKSL